MKRRIAFIAFLLMAPEIHAKSNPFGLPAELDERLLKGFEQLFNSDFKAAAETLSPLKNQANQYPLLALADVVRYWWEMSSNVMEVDEQESQNFVKAADATLELTQKKIDKREKTAEAHFAVGTTLGLMSRWSAANRAWLPAFMRGNKATAHIKKALEKNPRAVDSYMTLGTFNYARSLIAERLNSSDVAKDSPENHEGLAQLRKVYTDGYYFKQAAGLLLAGILTNDDPPEALPLLQELRVNLSSSPFVHMVYITALYNNGDGENLEKEADDYLRKLESGVYDPFYYPHGYFSEGLVAFRQKKWSQAIKEFDRAIGSGSEKNPYTTWAILYKGYALDAQGKRKRAKEQYETVLKLKRRFASHDHARERLAKPFKPTDVELKKLEV